MVADYDEAHKHCYDNRKEIAKSEKAGCFYCHRIFDAKDVKEWISGEETALCPYCGIDAVIGDICQSITAEFLEAMYEYWFSPRKKP